MATDESDLFDGTSMIDAVAINNKIVGADRARLGASSALGAAGRRREFGVVLIGLPLY